MFNKRRNDYDRQLFTQDKCNRCDGDLSIKTMSWFTNETICDECSEKEDQIKGRMRSMGKNPDDFEGCGFMPLDF